jgi:hypothetical protein
MISGIITSIQQSNAYRNFVAGSVPEKLAGRTVEIIGAASAVVSPYFQRKPVAFVALVVANMVSMFFSAIICTLLLSKEEGELDSKSGVGFFVGYGVGVIAFSKFTHLPFGKLMNTAISVATFIGVLLYANKNRKSNSNKP